MFLAKGRPNPKLQFLQKNLGIQGNIILALFAQSSGLSGEIRGYISVKLPLAARPGGARPPPARGAWRFILSAD